MAAWGIGSRTGSARNSGLIRKGTGSRDRDPDGPASACDPTSGARSSRFAPASDWFTSAISRASRSLIDDMGVDATLGGLWGRTVKEPLRIRGARRL